MLLKQATRIPVATYRLQLHREFDFPSAKTLIPYFRDLGITDYYCSPILQSAPGSQHGYDVNDYRTIEPELGGSEGLRLLSNELREQGMGLLVDFVPNHMGIQGSFNLWWQDILENGPNSPYARFFDIYWRDTRMGGRARVLVPVLEDHYGLILEQGRLKIEYDSGTFSVSYGELKFPLRPHSYGRILSTLTEGSGPSAAFSRKIRALSELFSSMPDTSSDPEQGKHRVERLTGMKKSLAELIAAGSKPADAIKKRLAALNGVPIQPETFGELDDILEEQYYCLARWQAGMHSANYRRFFAINSLIGLRMEIPEVFAESHALLGELICTGDVTGLRIDHIDGLWDPQEYLERLQEMRCSAESGKCPPLYVVVEKILEGNEHLPESWPVHGTTGYDFISQLSRLLVDPRSKSKFCEVYACFTGSCPAFKDVVREKKLMVIDALFAHAVDNMADALIRLLKSDRCWRDLTAHEVSTAIREIIAGMSVYRTYRRREKEMSQQDKHQVELACLEAIRRNPRLDPEPIEFIGHILKGTYQPASLPPEHLERINRWVMAFQQYTGAVIAKGVEDTALYTFNRFIALNEVGCDPDSFGGHVSEFHSLNLRRLHRSPHSMLSTSSHDTKISEDVRARLYALSEIPDQWEAWLREWKELNHRHKTEISGRFAPDANEEYRLYQILLGSWPHGEKIDEGYRERIRQYLRKAVSEAKENTTWHHPNDEWLEAGNRFVNALLDEGDSRFMQSFRPKAHWLSNLGMLNSLVQVVLKITLPGIPDFYQGNEVWDLSLVDPDNRRPVNYGSRASMLEGLKKRSVRHLLKNWTDGAIKLKVTQALLEFRKRRADLFRSGDYIPLMVKGQFADNVVAFRRNLGEQSLVVVVPRLVSSLGCPPLGLVWQDTRVVMDIPPSEGTDVVSGKPLEICDEIALADALIDLPFLVARVG